MVEAVKKVISTLIKSWPCNTCIFVVARLLSSSCFPPPWNAKPHYHCLCVFLFIFSQPFSFHTPSPVYCKSLLLLWCFTPVKYPKYNKGALFYCVPCVRFFVSWRSLSIFPISPFFPTVLLWYVSACRCRCHCWFVVLFFYSFLWEWRYVPHAS